MEWISVDEKLPEHYDRVIVYATMVEDIEPQIITALYAAVEPFWHISGRATPKVTHWMPLPEPPQKQ